MISKREKSRFQKYVILDSSKTNNIQNAITNVFQKYVILDSSKTH